MASRAYSLALKHKNTAVVLNAMLNSNMQLVGEAADGSIIFMNNDGEFVGVKVVAKAKGFDPHNDAQPIDLEKYGLINIPQTPKRLVR